MGTESNINFITEQSTNFFPINISSKEELSVGTIQIVSPEALEENYTVSENISPHTNSTNNNKETTSKNIINRYDINQIRQFILKGYDLSKAQLDKMTDEEVITWVNGKVTEFENDETIKVILKEYPEYKENIIEIFFSSGFFAGGVIHAVDMIFNNKNTDKTDKQKIVSDIIQTLVLQNTSIDDLEAYKENCENKSGLCATLNITKEQLSDKENHKNIIVALKEHLNSIKDSNERAKEIIRLIEFSNKQEKKILLNFIKINANMEDGIDLGEYFSNANTTLKVFLGQTDFAWERAKIFAEIGMESIANLDETLRKDLFDMFKEGGYISEIIKNYNIAPERLTEIITNLKNDPSYISKCSDTEKEFIEEIYPVLKQLGINADIATATSKTMDDDEKQIQMAKVHNLYREHLGESAYRDVIEGVYNYVQELQAQGIELNISYDHFAELMNAATNGNYELVMNDILRGDGVQTALNMEPVQPKSGNEGASAYNSETGMFDMPRDGSYNPYAAGENLAQLNQLYLSSQESTLPQLARTENQTTPINASNPTTFTKSEWKELFSKDPTGAVKIAIKDITTPFQSMINDVTRTFKSFDWTKKSTSFADSVGSWCKTLLENISAHESNKILNSGTFYGGLYKKQMLEGILEENKDT